MRSLALAVFAALLFPSVTGADEPPAQSAAAATPKVTDQSQRPDSPIAKQYMQILAEFEAQQAEYRQSRVKAESAARLENSPRRRGPPIWWPFAGAWSNWQSRPPPTGQLATLCSGC